MLLIGEHSALPSILLCTSQRSKIAERKAESTASRLKEFGFAAIMEHRLYLTHFIDRPTQQQLILMFIYVNYMNIT